MKKIICIASLFFFTTVTFAQTLGLSSVSVSHDIRDGSFGGMDFSGYSAEILHTEYLPDGTAEVFMSYAVWGSEQGFVIALLNEDSTVFQTWQFGESQKTGIISFAVPQQENNSFVFNVAIKAELPSEYSEPFAFSTIKKEAVAVPINLVSVTSFYDDVSVRDVIQLTTDTCEWSAIPLEWTFTKDSIFVKGTLMDGEETTDVIPVYASYRGMDDDKICLLFYETMWGTYGILCRKDVGLFVALTFNVSERVYPLK